MPPLDLLAGLIDQSGSNNRDALGASYRTPVFSSYSNSMCVPGAHHTMVLVEATSIESTVCALCDNLYTRGVYGASSQGEELVGD